MITCKRIKNYLDENYPFTETLSSLSNNPLINSQEVVYDFDRIKNTIYPSCCSADVLFIKKHINLIEFKTGFGGADESKSDKLKKENQVLKIKLKATDSLRLLDVCIIDEIKKIDNDTLDGRIQKTYCAVIDTDKSLFASDEMLTDIISEAGNVHNTDSYKTRIENSLKTYRKQTDHYNRLFFNEISVMYDFEFDQKMSNHFK